MLTFLLQLKLLVLVIVANGAPLLLYDLLRTRWGKPLDAGLRLPDGQRLFGPSVTVRGVIGAILATALCALLLGQPVAVGATIGLFAMLGDLASSFVKRRLGLACGRLALGLDQVPESLFPLLSVKGRYALAWGDIALTVLAFLMLELLLSRILFHLRLRRRPY